MLVINHKKKKLNYYSVLSCICTVVLTQFKKQYILVITANIYSTILILKKPLNGQYSQKGRRLIKLVQSVASSYTNTVLNSKSQVVSISSKWNKGKLRKNRHTNFKSDEKN